MLNTIKKSLCIILVLCLLPISLFAGCGKKAEPKWKIATSTADMHGAGYETDADAIRGLYEAGFRYIDYSMYGLKQDSVLMSDNWREEVLKIKAVADELGMTFVQAHSPGGNLLSTNQQEVDELIATTKRSIEICEVLGIKNTVVHVGWKDGLNRKQFFRMNMLMYYNLLPTAEKCGVNILCENSTKKNMQNFEYLSTGKDMREFVEFVNHPNFHACWDTGHANCDELDQYQNILDIGDELYAIHYAENDGSSDSHVMPFFGTLNHNDVVRALVDMGYTGYFTLECDGGDRTAGSYTGPEFSWLKKACPDVSDLSQPDALQVLDRAQQEKLLFDIANHIATEYPKETR